MEDRRQGGGASYGLEKDAKVKSKEQKNREKKHSFSKCTAAVLSLHSAIRAALPQTSINHRHVCLKPLQLRS